MILFSSDEQVTKEIAEALQSKIFRSGSVDEVLQYCRKTLLFTLDFQTKPKNIFNKIFDQVLDMIIIRGGNDFKRSAFGSGFKFRPLGLLKEDSVDQCVKLCERFFEYYFDYLEYIVKLFFAKQELKRRQLIMNFAKKNTEEHRERQQAVMKLEYIIEKYEMELKRIVNMLFVFEKPCIILPKNISFNNQSISAAMKLQSKGTKWVETSASTEINKKAGLKEWEKLASEFNLDFAIHPDEAFKELTGLFAHSDKGILERNYNMRITIALINQIQSATYLYQLNKYTQLKYFNITNPDPIKEFVSKIQLLEEWIVLREQSILSDLRVFRSQVSFFIDIIGAQCLEILRKNN